MSESDPVVVRAAISQGYPSGSHAKVGASAGKPRLQALAEYPQLRYLQPLLDALAGSVCILNESGTIIAINAAWQGFAEENQFWKEGRGLGLNYLEVCGRVTGECGDDAAAVAQGMHEVQARRRDQFRFEYACPGTMENRWFQVHVTRLDGLGNPWLLVMHDEITEVIASVTGANQDKSETLRRLKLSQRAASPWESSSGTTDEQVRQSQKMQAIGRLAGGIAHDFNNLLSVIIGCSEILMMKIHPADPRRKMAEEIEATGQRGAALTRQLLAFSRQQVLEMRVLDLNATVKDAESLLCRVIGENVHLVTRISQSVGSVKADPGQLEVAILNLALNARDAMPQGGELTLETLQAEVDDAFVRKHPYARRGLYAVLRISDTGVGIDDNHVEHIFEPFFTTKEKGKGTGLGLATVYGIIKQSGGYIWTQKREGLGTTFEIYLPRVDAEPDPATPVNAEIKPLRGRGTILLVEDEAALRILTRDFLRQIGYTVLEAATPSQAKEIVRGQARNPDLLLTDVVLSEGNGRELADALLPTCPGMKVLYVSGYTDDVILQQGGFNRGAAFLQKPFTLVALSGKVRELLKPEGSS